MPKSSLKLLEATLYNYKSIIETHIKFQPDITCLVGITGAGKTSILELLRRINLDHGFVQRDLSEGSKTLVDFINNEIQASDIPQLDATFEIDEMDKPLLPPEYKNVITVNIKRFFDGSWAIDNVSTGIDETQIDIQSELDAIDNVLRPLHKHIEKAEPRIPGISGYTPTVMSNVEEFIDSTKDTPLNGAVLLQNFKNNLFAIPHDTQLKKIFNHIVSQAEAIVVTIIEKTENDPDVIVYERVVPKPEYIAQLPPPTDSIPLDEYLNNEHMYEYFNAIGRICGFSKAGLNKIRNDMSARKRNFFEDASRTLTDAFREFWKQTKYDLIVSLNGQDLTFEVKDAISDKTTGITQRSEGLQWVISLFFKIKLLASSNGPSHILLLDSPATAVHDAGKEEIRKFMTTMAEENYLQIIYTTHEKALIDPWRLDRIRFVKKTKDEGTSIKEIKSNGINSTRIEVSKHVGSPAKYSLFGAPITILFEGPSDYRFIAALNEYAIKNSKKHLHPDVYAIDDMGGIDNAPNMTKILKDLEVKYICVVDGGDKTKTILRNMDNEEFVKNFVQITDVVDKQAADIEDLIDPKLYEHLFKKAYQDIDLPKCDDGRIKNQKTTTYYANILKEKSNKGLNKTGIATLLMDVVNNTPLEMEEPLRNTFLQYEKLIDIIEQKSLNC